MAKLLLKYILSLTLLAIVVLFVAYVVMTQMMFHTQRALMKTSNQGVFTSLQHQLAAFPVSEWPTTIEQLQPENGSHVSVIPLQDAKLNTSQMKKLLAGGIVNSIGSDVYFMGYITRDGVYTYQRITDSDYVLSMEEPGSKDFAPQVTAWMTHLLALELKHTPVKQWPNTIDQLQQAYGISMTPVAESSHLIPSVVKHLLAKQDFVLGKADKDGYIQYAYISLHANNRVLRLGPFTYSAYEKYHSLIVILVMLLLSITYVVLLTLFFSRNLDKIYKISDKYSMGDFSCSPKVNRYSSLKPLHDNIVSMGERIQSLMVSQTNMSRFVAHECRTPVSTMIFAIDDLKKEDLSQKSQQCIDSIEEDLIELNDLVKQFLQYSRYSGEEFTLDSQVIEPNAWLEATLAKYQFAPKSISYQATEQLSVRVLMDAELMKHVIDNLIMNALRHAQSHIQVSMQLTDTQCIIHVDNDGDMIDDVQKQYIFSPFMTLQLGQADQGFGLGLSIANTIVNKHRGHLTVSDAPHGGARFSISLPLA